MLRIITSRICIIIAFLALLWSVAAVRNTKPETTRHIAPEAYEVIRTGMTVSEVEQLIGRPADTINKGAVTSMMWFGRGVSFIQIRVDGDRVSHVSTDLNSPWQDDAAASE